MAGTGGNRAGRALDPEKILRYWRERLRDEDSSSLLQGAKCGRIRFNVEKVREYAAAPRQFVLQHRYQAEFWALYEAALHPNPQTDEGPLIDLFNDEIGTDYEGNSDDIDGSEASPIAVPFPPKPADVVITFAFSGKVKECAYQPLFWFGAQLEPDGNVVPQGDPPEFIPGVLESEHAFITGPDSERPFQGRANGTVGTYDEYDTACRELRFDEATSFAQFLDLAMMVFDRVTRGATDELIVSITPRPSGLATMYGDLVYQQLLTEVARNTLPPVVNQVLQPGEPIIINSTSGVAEYCERHLAGDKPLNHSQRRALLALTRKRDDTGIIVVSGPPGTGKTTLLRTMIANEWVHAACRRHFYPPRAIACGATNKSVQNVLGTFDNALGSDQLRKRWILDLDVPYSLSFPSQRLAGDNDHLKTYGVLLRVGFARKNAPEAERVKSRHERGRIKYDGQASYRGSSDSLNALSALDVPALGASYLNELTKYLNSPASLSTKTDRDLIDRAKKEFANEANALTILIEKHAQWQDICDQLLRLKKKLNPAAEMLAKYIYIAKQEASKLRSSLLVDRNAWEDARKRLRPVIRYHVRNVEKKTLRALNRAEQGIEREQCVELILDQTLRPLAFHLAARYWECRWIASLPCVDPDPEQHWKLYSSPGHQLARISMLSPCIVSTLYTVPRLMRPRSSRHCFDFGSIELVIIDEAGQALPNLAIPALAFGKRAVVVGDLKQLAPVSPMTVETERRRLSLAGLDFEHCSNRGVTMTGGSAMKVCATAASFKEPHRQGLILREHYRCPRSIISFCIDLLYHDPDHKSAGGSPELVPCKPDYQRATLNDIDAYQDLRDLQKRSDMRKRRFSSKQFPLPALGFFQVGAIRHLDKDAPIKNERGSWLSNAEARAIAWWLHDDGVRLAQWLAISKDRGESEKLEDLVAIVSPFRGQVTEINAEIRKRFADCADAQCPCKLHVARGSLEKLTIGTVHTMQGDERPVVLFSAVNSEPIMRDGWARPVFIDRDGGNLLNVAASRAQCSFILFGHADLFFSAEALDPQTDRPTALLGRWMAGVREPQREKDYRVRRRPGVRIGPQILMAVESPAKCREISQWLPPSVQAFATGGHLRDLATLELTPENGFAPVWRLNSPRTAQRLDKIASRLIGLPMLAIGTDPDPEGEAIAWHLLQLLERHPLYRAGACNGLRVRRALFSTPAKPDISAALRQLHEVRTSAAMAAIARRVADGMVGRWWKVEGGGVDCGRVKAPLYRALSQRDEASENDEVGEQHWRIVCEVQGGVDSAPAWLFDTRFARRATFDKRTNAQIVCDELSEAQITTQLAVDRVEFLRIEPPKGLGTADVIESAWQRWGWHPQYVMDVLASLRLRTRTGKTRHGKFQWSGEAGEAIVNRLLAHGEISSRDFSARVEGICNAIVSETEESCEAAYKEAITRVAVDLYPGRRIEGISGPRGLESSWKSQHMTETLSRRDSDSLNMAGVLRDLAVVCAQPRIDPIAQQRIAAAATLGESLAHPPIMPVNLKADPWNDKITRLYGRGTDQHKLYRMIWERTIATRLRPAIVKRERLLQALSTASPYAVALYRYTLIDSGWFGAFRDENRRWSPVEWNHYLKLNHGMDASVALPLFTHVSKIRIQKIVCDHTIPSLLRYMVTNKLGRPSTYADHLSSFIESGT